jgi:hypothetical protein
MAELVHRCIDDAFMKLLEGDMKEAAAYFESGKYPYPARIVKCVLHSWRNVKINQLL